ncbi:Folate receptor alpha [Thelohanellus kitauei]|uniref:Folate receptor alpha n=1 Tax=Thelohanellus kitauei TaxID=669202 RepID=A0A0C2JGK5_THEKT|nr:Folate receptor alpha [Thelohanellus kitauei]
MQKHILWFLLFHTFTHVAHSKHERYCLKNEHDKSTPTHENTAEMGICQPWSNYSCCSSKTAQYITSPGELYIRNVLYNQCPHRGTLSNKCKRYFQLDQCFYLCGSMFLPWLVVTQSANGTKERWRGIPMCSSDCEAWYEACKDDFTCSATWYPSSFGTINGKPVCKTECRKFKDFHPNARDFCETIFKG